MSDLLRFESDVPLRRRLQPPGARKHPGKLHLGFLAYLLDRYAPRGGRLLDPFGGSGGLLLACLPPWGCSVTLNELEPQWVEQCRAAWAWMQASPAQPTGTAEIIQGDARALGGVGADALITLPPYADQFGIPTGINTIEEYIDAKSTGYRPGYDAVVTSPPYADAVGHQHESTLARHQAYTDFSRAQVISQGYDAVLTSPPYLDALSHQRHTCDDEREFRGDSPASAESRIALRHGYGQPTPGRRDHAQIGNLAGARYWAAMAAVWAACVPLVRPGGVLVVVLKNIVRANAEVDLLGGTRAQLEALGCRYVTTQFRHVTPGPFHRLRQKSNPDALIIDREGALVLEAPPC